MKIRVVIPRTVTVRNHPLLQNKSYLVIFRAMEHWSRELPGSRVGGVLAYINLLTTIV